MLDGGLHDRLVAAVGKRSYRALSELTATHPETVRRYMHGQAPSVQFVSHLCRALGISGDWLLTGRGPMRIEDTKAHALRQAELSELLAAVTASLESTLPRVERLELILQTLARRLQVDLDGVAEHVDGRDERVTHIPVGGD